MIIRWLFFWAFTQDYLAHFVSEYTLLFGQEAYRRHCLHSDSCHEFLKVEVLIYFNLRLFKQSLVFRVLRLCWQEHSDEKRFDQRLLFDSFHLIDCGRDCPGWISPSKLPFQLLIGILRADTLLGLTFKKCWRPILRLRSRFEPDKRFS